MSVGKVKGAPEESVLFHLETCRPEVAVPTCRAHGADQSSSRLFPFMISGESQSRNRDALVETQEPLAWAMPMDSGTLILAHHDFSFGGICVHVQCR